MDNHVYHPTYPILTITNVSIIYLYMIKAVALSTAFMYTIILYFLIALSIWQVHPPHQM